MIGGRQVDFRVNEEQKALQEGVRSFCDGRIAVDTLRGLEGTGGFDRALWTELAELGVFNMRLPEDRGGLGLGMVESVLVSPAGRSSGTSQVWKLPPEQAAITSENRQAAMFLIVITSWAL